MESNCLVILGAKFDPHTGVNIAGVIRVCVKFDPSCANIAGIIPVFVKFDSHSDANIAGVISMVPILWELNISVSTLFPQWCQ